MNARNMLKLCRAAHKRLYALEKVLPRFPVDRDIASFICAARSDVAELVHIAKLETANRVTVEQVSHVRQILSATRNHLQSVPDAAEKEPDEEV